MKDQLQLATTGFLQVFCVAVNAYTIAHAMLFWMVVSSFCINWLWSHNVKKIAFGGERDRVVYAGGAAIGCLCGFTVATFLARLG